ncbi:PHD finger protein 3 isoform X2 [Myripristis murdjan]|uniref:PHD finger protein 3 isoform X2 n=1 Tax=Myripristis murdjan TaxID=586833 RepID=UPI001176326D|nr:PHD finger protein 3 isoform X2 [Myripristis murdjan]
MDIVDTFNHLIPSDQLDDSLLVGQNLECEASGDFGQGLQLEDSLKNMLSDKDPMFGSASSQFNLLDNDDPSFQIAGSTGLDVASASSGLSGTAGELTGQETPQVKRPVGRPKRHPRTVEHRESGGQGPDTTSTSTKSRGRPVRRPVSRQQRSFLIEKGVAGPQLKKELTSGGRINIHDLEAGLWLNPVVVLRRLTVTVGGFRIELLPGPSYTENPDTGQSICFEPGFSYGGDIEYGMLQDAGVSVQNPMPENVRDLGVAEKSCAEDAPLGLGPYVNPNDVQAANGTLGSPCSAETKLDNQSVSGKPVSKGKDGDKEPQNFENNKTTSSDITDSKEKKQIMAKKVLKSKQGLTSVKNKDAVPERPSSTVKGTKVSQNISSKCIQRGDMQNMKSLKEKKGITPLKRHVESAQTERATKVLKTQDAGPQSVKPKSPGTSIAVVKKTLSSDSRPSEQQGPTKHTHSHVSPKPESAHLTHGPGHSSKTPEEGGQEKPKVKKPEKILQRQKSKNARSVSVDEPQLFVPDNAPVVKKETAEEQPANTETVWDGNNSCGLCKKHHNNTFMVGCGRCDDWFHGDCVGLDLTKVREMEEEDQMYVCLKCCAEESTKVEPDGLGAAKPEGQAKHEVQDNKLPVKPRQGPSQPLTSGGVRPARKDSDRRQSTEGKDAAQKTGLNPKQESKNKSSSSAVKKPVSVEEIRRSVRDSLKEILLQRLKESDLKVTLEKASEVAKKTERELFHLYKDTDNKYKNKYRSLMFNLKDTKNNVLFKRVLKGEISPSNLIRMNPEELASKELAAWRQRENRHTIEMIEKEQREAERRPITKITHKGEIEIESQEPVKAPETMELEVEPPPKVPEDTADLPLEKKSESTKTDKDTTSQHRSHLFDLHCKICTGRMAPPVEEAPTKVVKVATTVVRRQSTKVEETKSAPSPVKEDDLHLTVLEESFLNAKSASSEGRLEYTSGRDDEAAFLANLKSLWRGFINMPAVAKLVTKAFPVSGILDNVTEDLPDSIQVGGRISPQTVWDYLEKIRATGTKEVCLIRFSPETEEDEISYTLLYAYFSSRRRFGVVSNNLKQVKDMYLIPLGATEKVPHQLVPFDGPGLENNRSNLLLGLIIRQRPKRDFLPVDMNETARIIPESKPVTVAASDTRVTEEDEKFYFSSLPAAHTKETDKPLNTVEDADVTQSFEEASASEDINNQEPKKPLRFLPGVLVGWGGELPPLPDVGGKPTTKADNPQKTQQATKEDAASSGNSTKSPTAATPRERFVIKKKESKTVKTEPEVSSQTDTSVPNNLLGKDGAMVTHSASVSLKDKPPDVSTEAFLASLSTAPSGNEASSAVSANKGDVSLLSETEKGKPEGNSSLHSKSQATSDNANSSKPPLSGILKKSSAYSSVAEGKKMEEAQKGKTSQPSPLSPQPVPVLSSTRNDPVPLSQHGYSHPSQEDHKPGDEIQPNIRSSHSEREDPSMPQDGPMATSTVYTPSGQGPQAPSYVPLHTEASEFQHDSVMAPAVPPFSNAASFPLEQQLPQVPGSYDYPAAPPPSTFPPQEQNHIAPWTQDSAMVLCAPPGLQSQYPDSYSESSGQPAPLAKDYKRPEDRYSDPWERPRHTEDSDHYRRHSHHSDTHHGKKSRHHDRERGKKHERSHEDKYRERSRHHGHSEDRHGERRKERHHSDDYSRRHKDKHRHRRDSDHENGRRSSRDSYS